MAKVPGDRTYAGRWERGAGQIDTHGPFDVEVYPHPEYLPFAPWGEHVTKVAFRLFNHHSGRSHETTMTPDCARAVARALVRAANIVEDRWMIEDASREQRDKWLPWRLFYRAIWQDGWTGKDVIADDFGSP